MRAVLVSVSDAELRERRRRGLDRHDEMWQGELHLAPLPFWKHQDIVTALAMFLRGEAERRTAGVVIVGAGVHAPIDPTNDYRVPDLSFVAHGHESVIEERGIVGPADAVIEVRSPGDETYEKFPFFAALGVREIIVIDRDSCRPEVYRLAGKQYLAIAAAPDGWVTAEVLGVRLRRLTEREACRIETIGDSARGMEV